MKYVEGGNPRRTPLIGKIAIYGWKRGDINMLPFEKAVAINAAFLANHQGTFFEAVEELSDLWRNLTIDQVFCVNAWGLVNNVFRWGIRLISGGIPKASSARSLLDSSPLRDLLNRALSPEKNVVTGISKKIPLIIDYRLQASSCDTSVRSLVRVSGELNSFRHSSHLL